MSPSPFTLVSLLALALSPCARAAPFPFSGLGERSAADGVEPAFMRRSFDLVARLDYQPAIVYPTADTVWVAGTKVNVTWDPTLPKGVSQSQVGQTAYIYLGYEEVGSDSLHLDIDRPIGTKVPLYGSSSSYEFTLPADLASRSGYLLTLGSTGNQSPLFTIKAAAKGGVKASSSSSKKVHSTSSTKKAVSSSKKVSTKKTSIKKTSTKKTTTTKKATVKAKTTTTTKAKPKSTTTTKHKSTTTTTTKAKASASTKKAVAKSTAASTIVPKAFASSAHQINAVATASTSPATSAPSTLATLVQASSVASSSLTSASSAVSSAAASSSATSTSSTPATATAVAAAAITSSVSSGAKERYAVGAGAIGAVFIAVAALFA